MAGDTEIDNDVLPPLPRMRASSPKSSRRRNHIATHLANHTVVSSAVVSSPQASEVISTLIDSLTAISESARQQLKQEFDVPNYKPKVQAESERPRSPASLIPNRKHYILQDHVYDGRPLDDGEPAAAAPVIRFARSPPPRKTKKSKRNLRNLHSSGTSTTNASASQRPYYTSESRTNSARMGTPSIERVNGSSTSLPVSSKRGRSRSPHKILPPDPPLDQSATESVHSARHSSEIQDETQPITNRSSQVTRENQSPEPFPETHTDQNGAQDNHDTVTSPSTGTRIGALSPSKGGDLRESLIPFRRSSLRQSARGSLDETQRRSMGSRDLKDLKDLNIDSELIESDDSTVRRIRELQEARERRQNEWRNEAKRSEKPGKLNSASSPKKSNSYQSSQLAVTEVLVESEKNDDVPTVSATITASDLADMPAFISTPPLDDPPSPDPSPPAEQPSPKRNPTPPTESRPIVIQQHSSQNTSPRKRISVTQPIKMEPTIQDVKSISEEVDDFVTAPRLTQKLKHPRTGRMIAFSEVGDHDGFVVFCCVGMGLTRYVTSFFDELARTLRLRIITPDRPGIGESEPVPERLSNPLTWVDDAAVICDALKITRFSLLAHSAGSIYALATALKMPQHVRGRIHLLAPWIPPSQMPKEGTLGPDFQPVASLPMSHKILSVLPSPILKVANSRFLSTTAAAIEPKPKKSKKSKNLETFNPAFSQSFDDLSDPAMKNMLDNLTNGKEDEKSASHRPGLGIQHSSADKVGGRNMLNVSPSLENRAASAAGRYQAISPDPASTRLSAEARQSLYNSALTHRIWALTKLNANPATDLMICLERRKTIGFRYTEVTRSVVIRHGAKDTRVPVENVRWLQSVMKRCELRVLPEEDHGLLSSAAVMSSVLTEIGKEWEEWHKIAQDKERRKRDDSVAESERNGSIASHEPEARAAGNFPHSSDNRI